MEKSALFRYATRSEELIMKKFKQYLMSQDSWITITKSNVVAQHVDQWRSKPLHGQWPNLMLERSVNSSRWL